MSQSSNDRLWLVGAIGLFCPHTAATSPAGSPGSAGGVTVESTTSEPSTEVAGTPPEEQTARYGKEPSNNGSVGISLNYSS